MLKSQVATGETVFAGAGAAAGAGAGVLACLVSSNPGRPPERTIAGVHNGLDIGAIDRGSHTKGLGGVDECLSFGVHVVQCSVRVLLGPPSGGEISVVPVDCTIKGTARGTQ
jgi:hypothetical protein